MWGYRSCSVHCTSFGRMSNDLGGPGASGSLKNTGDSDVILTGCVRKERENRRCEAGVFFAVQPCERA